MGEILPASSSVAHYEHMGKHRGTLHYRAAALAHLYSADDLSEDFNLKLPVRFNVICLCFIALLVGLAYLLSAPIEVRSTAVVITNYEGTTMSSVVMIPLSRVFVRSGEQIVIISENGRIRARVDQVENSQANASAPAHVTRQEAGTVLLHVTYLDSPPLRCR
jgi:hypothetical protein